MNASQARIQKWSTRRNAVAYGQSLRLEGAAGNIKGKFSKTCESLDGKWGGGWIEKKRQTIGGSGKGIQTQREDLPKLWTDILSDKYDKTPI